jgi:hypothetical protein
MAEEAKPEGSIQKSAEQLIADLQMPAGFLNDLEKDSDWSFVIKLHALIEAAMTHALTKHVGNDEAQDSFARLPLHGKPSKISFSKALLNLTDEDRRFMTTFSEMRNELVHDIRNVNVTLHGHIGGLEKKKRRLRIRDLGYVDDKLAGELEKFVLENPAAIRWLIYRSTLTLLAYIQLDVQMQELDRNMVAFKIREAELSAGGFMGSATLKGLFNFANGPKEPPSP